MRYAVRVLIIAAFVAVLPGSADAKWTRLSTANFVFIGDASAGKIRATIAGSIEGDAVAIELLPDDYQPEAVVR